MTTESQRPHECVETAPCTSCGSWCCPECAPRGLCPSCAIPLSEALPDVVSLSDACPECGEAQVDALVWDDDGEEVTCATCQRTYTPGAP